MSTSVLLLPILMVKFVSFYILSDGEIRKQFTEIAKEIKKPTSSCTLYEARNKKKEISESVSARHSVYT